MLMSVRQMMGTLDCPQGSKLTRLPILLLFCFFYILVLSFIEHKEHRFLLPVIVISQIGTTYFFDEAYERFVPFRILIKAFLLFIFVAGQISICWATIQYPKELFSSLDIYHYFGQRVP